MVLVNFTKEMLDILTSIKGKTFISYEREKDDNFARSYGNLRINLDDYSIDLINEEKEFPFFDTVEGMAGFSCEKVNSQIPFKPMTITKTKIVSVNEIIKSIEIITDEIKIDSENYEIIFDNALIIKTENQTIMFSRDVWFSEIITISNHCNYDKIYPISEVIENWNNFGEWEVKVKRTKKVL